MVLADEWKIKLEEFKQSGLSQIAWCKARNIKYHCLKYWLYRTRNSEKSTNKPLFKELKPTGTSSIKLKWKNLSIEIDADFDEMTLRRFLKTLD